MPERAMHCVLFTIDAARRRAIMAALAEMEKMLDAMSARLALDAGTFNESDHPRAPDGRFGTGSGSEGEKRETTGKPVATLTGNELGEFGNDTKALRKAAIQWYRDNLQKNPAHRKDLGEIQFSTIGRNEFEHYSANPNKLKLLPALREIVEKGTYKGREAPDHPRKDGIVAFHTIEANVSLSGKTFAPQVLVGERKDGKLFYDLFTEAHKKKSASPNAGAKIQVGGADSKDVAVLNLILSTT
ncbi:MAG: hypothetical protein LBP58_06935 [Azoarcus sp.]|jgi:hypothetical protein|nr:hypothetical protein [Azoarcus sp.]